MKGTGLALMGLLVASGFPLLATAQSSNNTLVVAISAEPSDVTPLTGAWNNGFIGGQIFDPLLTLAANGSVEPSLATSWSVNTNNDTYTFHLRHGVEWSDGQPFTSQDVKFSFENILNTYDVFGSTFFANTTVSTPDNYTAVIKPALFLPGVQLTLFASGNAEIYPQHVLQGQDFLKSTFRTTTPVGTGPYMLTKWVAGQYIQLDANPHWWGGTPKISTILVKFISDPASITAGLQSGEINMMNPEGIPYESVKALEGQPSLNVINSTQPPYVGAFWINMKDPILSNVLVRQALAYAFNRTEMIQGGTAGVALPGQAPIDPNYVPQSPGMTIYNYNVSKANALLDQAGYPKAANGTRFSLSVLVPNSQPELVSDSQIAKTELAAVGINLNIQETDFGTYLSLLGQENFQLFAVTYWTSQIWAYNLYDSKFIGKGPFQNNFQWNNTQADQYIEGFLTASTQQQVQSNLQQFENLFSQQLPAIVLYRSNWVYVTTSNVQGPALPNGRYIFVEPNLASETLGSSSTSTTTSGGMTSNTYLLIAAAVVAVVVIAAIAVLAMRRKKPATPAPGTK